jgi:glutaredoxin
MLFLCYPKCSTCQKARKWLDEHGIKYTERHIAEKNPTYDELKVWYQQSGLPIKKFFNTSGLVRKGGVKFKQGNGVACAYGRKLEQIGLIAYLDGGFITMICL